MRPLFLNGPSGKLFASLYQPPLTDGIRSWVLFVPPFAEEMNKCRPMVSKQARTFAGSGVGVLVPDLYGTGDSDGDFSDADWSKWRSDLLFLLHWIRDQGEADITLWGVRSGCLLASDLLVSLTPDAAESDCLGGITKLIFWQPVLNGEQYLKQFLRLRVAAAMMDGDKVTVADLKKQSDRGQVLEVAGYTLSSDLVRQFGEVSLKDLSLPKSIAVSWFDVASAEGKAPSPVARGLIERWQSEGTCVSHSGIQGEPFWSTQEISKADDLIPATCHALDLSTVIEPSRDSKNVGDDAGSFLEEMVSEEPLLEIPLTFDCEGDALVGVLHQACSADGRRLNAPTSKGVLLVVGGPQYRVGSHRQFVLLARHLARSGIPVFRFDYRGMGDSSGSLVGFEGIQLDIAAAMDCFQRNAHGLTDVILWGLCDAASAAAFYAAKDKRVRGLVLLNPWAYSEKGEAKAFLKHYYLQRLLSKSFWQKVLSGKFRPGSSLGSLNENISKARRVEGDQSEKMVATTETLSNRIYKALKAFKGKALIILSGNDLTAAQFKDAVAESSQFKRLMKQSRVLTKELPEADHTFSSRVLRDRVAVMTVEWIKSW